MKKSGWKRLRPSTFMRYALSYISLITLILAGLFGYMYFYVNREAQERLMANHVNRLSRIAYQHEGWVDTMLNTAVQIGLSPFIEPFSYAEEPARAYDLLRQMAPYTVTNSFCDQIYLCFTGDDHVYSSASSMTLDMFLSLVQYEHVSKEELLGLIRSPGALTILPAQQVESSLIDGNRLNMVTFLIPLGVGANGSKGTMMFLIKESVYQSMFADAIEDDNNTYVLHGDRVLASSADFPLPPDAVLKGLEDAAQGGSSTSFSWNGEEWTALSTGVTGWNMRYVTVLRAADLHSSIWNHMLPLFILLAAMTALGIPVALLLARRNMRPIREISSMLPEKSLGGDELATIQTGIRELSARNTDLTYQLERSLPMQRHEFTLRFMKGRYLTREEAVAAAAGLGMAIDKPYYAVVLSGAQDHDDQPLDLRVSPFKDVAGVLACGVELVALKAQMYLVFSDTREAILRLAELIRLEGMERCGHAIVALSSVQTDFSCAPAAYLEAASAFDNRFVMDQGGILDYASISTSIDDILPQARKVTDGINQALLLRNRGLLSGKIDELLHFLKHTNMSPFAFRLIYNDVIATLLREHTEALGSARSVQELYDIFSLSSCQSVDDLDALLRRLCDSIIMAEDHAEPGKAQAEEPSVISQVVSYMRDHFADPELSISAIAEAFEMPTARLSLAFKDVMRMSPLEYLTLLRVEHSKKLLSGSDLSIKEIAAAVGYYDASGFIRRFKQMTGVTPLQYRRSKEESGHGSHIDS